MDALIAYLTTPIHLSHTTDYIEYLANDIYNWVLVFALLFLFIEIMDDTISKRQTKERILETLSSLLTQVPFYLSELLIFVLAISTYFAVYEMVPWKLPVDGVSFIAVLLLADLIYYVEHYFMHKMRLFWLAHSVHHSSSMMNTATAFRFSLFDPIISALFHLPLVLLGFHPIYIFAAEILIQAYQFWLHNEMIGKLGPMERLFNTPSHHRVHHGSDPQYIDKNFGGILIIWDRLFGTFAEEQQLPRYGLTTPMTSKNPITVQFYEFYRLRKDLQQHQNWKQKLTLLLRAPTASA